MRMFTSLLLVLLIIGTLTGAAQTEEKSDGKLNPEVVGSIDLPDVFTRVTSIDINGQNAWISGTRTIEKGKYEYPICVLDLNDPLKPQIAQVLKYDKDYSIVGFKDNYMFCTLRQRDKNSQVVIFDISDVKNPSPVKTIETNSQTYLTAGITGNYLIVTSACPTTAPQFTMSLYEITKPTEPVLLSDKVVDSSYKTESSTLPGIALRIVPRNDLVYLLLNNGVYTLEVKDSKLYLLGTYSNSMIDNLTSISVVPETMDRFGVFLMVAGFAQQPLEYPEKINPDPQRGRQDEYAGIELLSHDNDQAVRFTGHMMMGRTQAVRLPVDFIRSIGSQSTLAYVFGTKFDSSDPAKQSSDNQVLVVDFGKTYAPKIVGSLGYSGMPGPVAINGVLAYVINDNKTVKIIKLPTVDQEFERLTYKSYDAPYPEGKQTPIKEKGIDSILRNQAGKLTGTLKPEDFSKTTKLELVSAKLTDLKGIQICTNLEELNLQSNYITDISPLKDLRKLKVLNISGCKVTDLSPLSGLSELRTLEIAGNDYKDITPILKLGKLEELTVSTLTGIDLTPLNALTGLKILDIGNSDVKSIEFLKPLKNLTSLTIAMNSVKDISVLADLPELEYLDLSMNYIRDYSVLGKLNKLGLLKISDSKLSDISFIKECTSLKKLLLNRNNIENVSAITGLNDLIKLDLDGNQITDVTPLAGNRKLLQILIRDNKIKDVSSLSNLENLLELALSNNQITNIDEFGELDKLYWLDLSKNELSEISSLTGMDNLKSLYLTGNKITDLKPLGSLPKLEIVVLDGNQVTDITPLTRIPGLVSIDFSRNQVSDMSPLLNNKWKSKEVLVYPYGNPLSDASLKDMFGKLKHTNIVVGPDEKEENCVFNLIGIAETSNRIRLISVKGEFASFKDVLDNMIVYAESPTMENILADYKIVVFKTEPSKIRKDGSKTDPKLTIITVPNTPNLHRIFGITQDLIALEWIGDTTPVDFSTVSMTDENLWRKWPAQFFQGDTSASCYSGG